MCTQFPTSSVKSLPKPAQVIFTTQYNKTFKQTKNSNVATIAAWEAVLKVYTKGKKFWIKRRL